ncbi:MAG: hypothetical protein BGO49_14660 [Planctomycetales bacterium 71-10]|nr:MAG: hypothetical protein BGO49_14660 [Planctomycetales bacterium 71-10]
MHRIAKVSVLWIVSAAGCGGGAPAVPAPTHEEARKHLETALDAWKGGKVKGLATASPPIRFVDPDQAAGAKLDSYHVGDESRTVDHVVDYPVEVTITDKKRAKRTVKAVYQVVAEPGIAVLRNDD